MTYLPPLEEAARPASDAETLNLIERLRRHYPARRDLDVADYETIHEDWLRDFAEFPKPLLELACKRWRNSHERFAPTSGQLKVLVSVETQRLSNITLRLVRAAYQKTGELLTLQASTFGTLQALKTSINKSLASPIDFVTSRK